MKPMLLTPTTDLPEGKEWIYEVKYDGFRVILEAKKSGIKLWSRNGKDLSDRFPEISRIDLPSSLLPVTLDGELVILNTLYQTNFPQLQIRGRMRNINKIQVAAQKRPATFFAFDYLDYPKQALTERKKRLSKLIQQINHPLLKFVETFDDLKEIRKTVQLHKAEGIVAKVKSSLYRSGDRVQQWLKWKNWKTVSGFLMSYDPKNGYYEVGIEEKLLGRFKHGLSSEEADTLQSFFKEKGHKQKGKWFIDPSICVDVHCLEAHEEELREPVFHQFRFDLSPDDCTYDKLQWDLSNFPDDFQATHTEKKLWPSITKKEYLQYVRNIAPYMLPFLIGKKLTLIRYPDGINQESFYQKHHPDHAPDYVREWRDAGEKFIICDNLHSLIWLANQGSLEYHIPFEKAEADHPDEIVLDLDPPDRDHFNLAVIAARLFKHLLDELEVVSFIKTSGNKGMQIHIPIQEEDLTYEETRKITESLAVLLVKEEPELFTIERLKKNRGKRLYIDYVQHAEGKTIIAPYSARATDKATIATPLFWEEVNEDLKPEWFTVNNVLERIDQQGCPFADYNKARKHQPIRKLKELL